MAGTARRHPRVRVKWLERRDEVGRRYALLQWMPPGSGKYSTMRLGFVADDEAESARAACEDEIRAGIVIRARDGEPCLDPIESAKGAGSVYLVHANGLFKIGFSTADAPHARIRRLQTGSAVPLQLVTWVRGTKRDEKRLHELFSRHRRQGEWFAAHPNIRDAFAVLMTDPTRRP